MDSPRVIEADVAVTRDCGRGAWGPCMVTVVACGWRCLFWAPMAVMPRAVCSLTHGSQGGAVTKSLRGLWGHSGALGGGGRGMGRSGRVCSQGFVGDVGPLFP